MVELRHPRRDDGVGLTPGIHIRPYRHGDEPLLFEAATESVETVYPWLPWCHPGYTLEEAKAWVDREVDAFADGVEFDFVVEADDGRFLGACGVNQLHPVNRFANLGYWIRRSAIGRGFATAAVHLVRDWTFANTDLERLEIVVAVENHASLRVAEKSGAVREGVLRKRLFLHGAPHDAVMFSFVKVSSEPPRCR